VERLPVYVTAVCRNALRRSENPARTLLSGRSRGLVAARTTTARASMQTDARAVDHAGSGLRAAARHPGKSPAQWKLSPHAHEPCALGLSIVKPCFWMVSSKSIEAPSR